MPRKKVLQILQPCRLLVDLPENKLKAGARGTVLHTYLRAKRWYHVEFLNKRLYRLDVRPLEENEIEGLPFDYTGVFEHLEMRSKQWAEARLAEKKAAKEAAKTARAEAKTAAAETKPAKAATAKRAKVAKAKAKRKTPKRA
jgi:uncharacterized protein DUF4926